jgi:hypothetical protein
LKEVENSRPYEPRSDNPIGSGERQSRTGHSINDRARAILNDCAAAGGTQGAKSF